VSLRDPGSFKDPSGYVFIEDACVWRTVNPCAAEAFSRLRDSGLLEQLADRGLLIETEPFSVDAHQGVFEGVRGERPVLLLRHPKINFVSYPYEWVFSQLKAAALVHLELQLLALDRGFALSDSTPYNMQFDGARPIHIDVLSLRPYREGEVWAGYNQFCRQFLFPLLLESWKGVPFQPMLRGRLDGMSVIEAADLLPWRKRWLTLNGMLHVGMHARAERSASSSARSPDVREVRGSMSKARYRAVLSEMQQWVSSLASSRRAPSYWGAYAANNSYSDEMRGGKCDFVAHAVRRARPRCIWDLGGNTGDFSRLAFDRASKSKASLLSLFMDCADPSPSMGWSQEERKGWSQRGGADMVLALALVHHLAIGRNIPLASVVQWIVSLAPQGVIEFVPKRDPMVQGMLSHRDDVFADYDETSFRTYLSAHATVLGELRLESNGRLLLHYERP
jgi:ribosomal protein L11 methylase PrmA